MKPDLPFKAPIWDMAPQLQREVGASDLGQREDGFTSSSYSWQSTATSGKADDPDQPSISQGSLLPVSKQHLQLPKCHLAM